jgi:hypothetical protein
MSAESEASKQPQNNASLLSNGAPSAPTRKSEANTPDRPRLIDRVRGAPRFLPDPQVAKRYGVSQRTLPRWDRTPGLNFPPPFYINNRKYRDEGALDQFDREREARSAQDAANARRAIRHQRREPEAGETAEAASATKS